MSSEEWRFVKHAGIATLFAMVAGYADVVSLVRYQAFSSILTGNVIYLGKVAVNPQPNDKSAWLYVMICAAFMIGAFMQRLCELKWPNRGGSIAAVPLTVVMTMVEIVYFVTGPNFQETYLKWTVVCVSPLFGVVSAACSTGRMGTHTTMVTGHILTVTQLLARRLYGEDLGLENMRKLIMSLFVILATVFGACCGSLAIMSTKSHILLFPIPLVTYALLWLHDHLARPRSFIKKVQKKLREKAAASTVGEISESDDAGSLEGSDEASDSDQV